MKGEHQIETILTKAQDIVYNRTEEQSRNYGDIQESIERAALIASHISTNIYSPEIIYTSIIAIKLSREAHAHKEDNLLDAVAYISALNDYLENKKP
jgi:phosphoenolpyruvate synthase/pyruvate phosphate dikinase